MFNEKNMKKTEEQIRKFKESSKKRSKKYYEKNKEKIIERCKSYYNNNKETINFNKKLKKSAEKSFSFEKLKMKKNLLYNINIEYNKRNLEKPKNIEDILGCSYDDFYIYIEKYFRGWVSWKDYGYKKGERYTYWILSYKDKTLEINKLNNYNNFEIKILEKKSST